MAKKYVVRPTREEREMLLRMAKAGKRAARKLTHARVLLKADADGIRNEIAARMMAMDLVRIVMTGASAAHGDVTSRG